MTVIPDHFGVEMALLCYGAPFRGWARVPVSDHQNGAVVARKRTSHRR